ncbi:MAG: tetratricopeptide (TPR) repeat protein [Paraglaciecola sp.]|jgi:tetratricopeptide (TPR) repeat protein
MRVWLFRIIALAIPFLFFILLEVFLRLGGFGREIPLFIENPANPHYILPRPDIVKRYFAEGADIPNVTMEANFLLKEKPENGLRIFVQGGSTAAGFPYGLGASLAGMLEQRLKHTFPDKYVEVVNTAMAAVNSYTLLDLADEVIQQKPDAVLIYAGHNEYLGILGVGSNYTAANSQATTLLFLKLKDFRTFQLVQRIYHWSKNEEPMPGKESQQSRTFMAKVAKHKNIPLGSDIYTAGLAQFETNLSLLLDKYQQAKVPVFVSTITSNLKDQKPFSSAPMADKLSDELQALLGDTPQLATNTIDKERLALLAQNAVDDNSALLQYRLGQLYLGVGEYDKALKYFISARDNDLLRFRAPTEMNEIIRTISKEKNAYLVDVERNLSTRSPFKIIGNNFMLEHLHMNVQGYFLLADTFYQAFKNHNTLGDWHDVSTQEAWKMRPILPSEEYNGYAKIQQLKADYPFSDGPTPLRLTSPADWQQKLGQQLFQRKIDWLKMMQQSAIRYKAARNIPLFNKTNVLIAEALPHDKKINLAVANQYSKNGQFALSTSYYQRAILAGDKSKTTYRALVKALKNSNQIDKAQQWQQKLAEL